MMNCTTLGIDVAKNEFQLHGVDARRAKAGFCRCLVSLLAEYDIDEIPRTIYCPIEIRPASFYFDVGFVRVPTRSDPSPPMFPQHLA